METSLITQEALQKVTGGLIPIRESVRSLVVKTASDLQVASNIRASIKGYEKTVNNWFKPLEDNAKAQVKELKDKKALVLQDIIPLLTVLDGKSQAFNDEEDRKIRIAKAKAEDELRKIRAEQQRKVDELNAKELKIRQEAEAKETKLREAGKLAQAEVIRLEGLKKTEALQEKAATILTTPIESKVIIPEKTKVEGMSMVTYYSAEVVNADDIDRSMMVPNQQLADRLAREEKEGFNYKGWKLVTDTKPRGYTKPNRSF